jgi:hypothetical protein
MFWTWWKWPETIYPEDWEQNIELAQPHDVGLLFSVFSSTVTNRSKVLKTLQTIPLTVLMWW